jgi:hypothetical protein
MFIPLMNESSGISDAKPGRNLVSDSGMVSPASLCSQSKAPKRLALWAASRVSEKAWLELRLSLLQVILHHPWLFSPHC